MARLPYPDPAGLESETREVLSKLGDLNIYRMMAGGEGLLRAFARMGSYLLFKAKLDPHLRELAILRTGILSNARYEVHQHMRIARDLGMGAALIEAARFGADSPGLTDLQRHVIRFVDDVVRNVRAHDTNFKPLAEQLGMRALQELTVTIGYYMMVSRFLETFDVDIEQNVSGGSPISGLTQPPT